MKRVFAYFLLTTTICIATQETPCTKKPVIATTQGLTQEWIHVVAGETVITLLLDSNTPPNEQPVTLVIEIGPEENPITADIQAPCVVLSDGLPLLKTGQRLQPKSCKRLATQGKTATCCCGTAKPEARLEPVFHEADQRTQAHPYPWMDVSLAMSMIVSLTETLCDLAPENMPLYKARSEAYLQKLEALDLQIFNETKNLSKEARKEPNASWLYFTRRYGLEPGNIEGKTTLPALSIEGQRYIEAMQAHAARLKEIKPQA
jgi:ABC-type Zn uptake system ZnuABC Zn-binding protein ZnuA